MFSLVALLCFYAGINNIVKAFKLAPFGMWTGLNWLLLLLGAVLVVVGAACVWQANKDFQEKKKADTEKHLFEKEKRQRQYYYDEKENTDN